MKRGQHLRLTTTKGLINKPVLDGAEVDCVVRIDLAAEPFDLPHVTLHLLTDVVFNGRAWVRLVDVIPETSPEARREFASALNEADVRARTKARDAARQAAGLTPTSRRSSLPQSVDTMALLDELDALGWGFHRKRKGAA